MSESDLVDHEERRAGRGQTVASDGQRRDQCEDRSMDAIRIVMDSIKGKGVCQRLGRKSTGAPQDKHREGLNASPNWKVREKNLARLHDGSRFMERPAAIAERRLVSSNFMEDTARNIVARRPPSPTRPHRAVPHRPGARPRGHGDGLPLRGHRGRRPPGRAQGRARSSGRRRRADRALQARDPEPRSAAPPEHRAGPLRGRARGAPVLRDGVRARPRAQQVARRGRDAARSRSASPTSCG